MRQDIHAGAALISLSDTMLSGSTERTPLGYNHVPKTTHPASHALLLPLLSLRSLYTYSSSANTQDMDNPA